MKNTNKKYDVILYGASGFTGRQTVAYFLEHAPANLKWALAGRNKKKLLETRDSFAANPNLSEKLKQLDCLEAESGNKEAIDSLVSSTRVILSTAGPFSLYGRNLLAACAEQGVDYVDITGETAFVRDLMDSHGEVAQKSGAKLIPFSGFDSVPTDIAVFSLANYFKDQLDDSLVSAKGVYSIQGGFNGGTLLSMITMLESGDYKRMSDPAILMPKSYSKVRLVPDSFEVSYEPLVKKWIAPFLMAMINTRVVNRTAALLESYGMGYAPDFSYTEHHGLGSFWNPIPAYALANGFKAFQALGQWGAFRDLLKKLGPGASEGPSEEARNSGFYHLEVIGTGAKGNKAILTFSGKGDPGNQATVLFACESALALAIDRDKLPGGNSRSGFLTPATGLGSVLIERLKQSGVTIATDVHR